ncbi:MAG TPA: hypothetical protein VF006_31265 [Longimicrobium sp.]
MSPILAGAVAAGVHFTITLAAIVIGTGPTDRRREAGSRPTLYDRSLLAALRALTFPVHQVTERFPGLLNRTGWPREHLLLMGNSALWGIAAGLLVFLI